MPSGDGDGARFAVTGKYGCCVGPYRQTVIRKEGLRVEMRDEKGICTDQMEEDRKRPSQRLARVVDELPAMVKISHEVQAPSTVRLAPLPVDKRLRSKS